MSKDTAIKNGIIHGLNDKAELVEDKLFELYAGYRHQFENDGIQVNDEALEHIYELAFFLENVIFRCAMDLDKDLNDVKARVDRLGDIVDFKSVVPRNA